MSTTSRDAKTDTRTRRAKQERNAGAKPNLAYVIATGLGLGYLPLTPGTWGSLLGIFLAWLGLYASQQSPAPWLNFAEVELAFIVIVSVAGLWAAEKVTRYSQKKDPQIVVVDEIAGQLIAYLALATPRTFSVNWKYLLLGFILFRVLDVWKPFPARQAESLPGGLGIMADDWMAGAYAALGLWLVRYFLH